MKNVYDARDEKLADKEGELAQSQEKEELDQFKQNAEDEKTAWDDLLATAATKQAEWDARDQSADNSQLE